MKRFSTINFVKKNNQLQPFIVKNNNLSDLQKDNTNNIDNVVMKYSKVNELLQDLVFKFISALNPSLKKDTMINLLKSYSSMSELIFTACNRGYSDAEDQEMVKSLNMIKNLVEGVLKDEIINQNISNVWTEINDYMRLKLGKLNHEVFIVLYLDTKLRIIFESELAIGFSDKVAVDIKDIIKNTSNLNASSVILVHNHPSGECEPSKEDIDLTHEICMLLEIVGISIFDHIIVTEKEIFSFKKNYLL